MVFAGVESSGPFRHSALRNPKSVVPHLFVARRFESQPAISGGTRRRPNGPRRYSEGQRPGTRPRQTIRRPEWARSHLQAQPWLPILAYAWPKGRVRYSEGQRPGTPPRRIRAAWRVAIRTSIPHVPLVQLHSRLPAEPPKLVLERVRPVVLFLSADVSNDCRHDGRSH